ncbi:MAG: ComEA family DNA-binding protein [Bacteroidia bacterium]|nr:ComEA family DNA-binding protein [Bacteroidia bacterium]
MDYLSKKESLSLEFADPFFTSPVYTRDSAARLDINLADSAHWVSLKGIGPVLAKRILNYRRSLGGFSSIDQVAQVYGLPPETYEAIVPFLFVNEITAPAKKTPGSFTHSNSREEYPLLDINRATGSDFKKLPGIGDVLSERIIRYRNSLRGFESVDDLGAVYGLKPETLEEIRDYLFVNTKTLSDLRKQSPEVKTDNLLAEHSPTATDDYSVRSLRDLPFSEDKESAGFQRGHDPATKATPTKAVDLNQADSAQLITIPGIGPVLSAKIVKYRNKVGFFYHISQLHEVYGLSEENYQRMIPYLYLGETRNYPRKDLNTAFARVLAGYPAIDPTLAENIILHRKKTGRFDSWEEVSKIKDMTPEALEVLKAYFEL